MTLSRQDVEIAAVKAGLGGYGGRSRWARQAEVTTETLRRVLLGASVKPEIRRRVLAVVGLADPPGSAETRAASRIETGKCDPVNEVVSEIDFRKSPREDQRERIHRQALVGGLSRTDFREYGYALAIMSRQEWKKEVRKWRGQTT